MLLKVFRAVYGCRKSTLNCISHKNSPVSDLDEDEEEFGGMSRGEEEFGGMFRDEEVG